MGFVEHYGIDVEIKIVRYEKIEDMVDKFRLKGRTWGSFDIDRSSYYNIYSEITSLPNTERKKKEMQIMN